MKAALLFVLLLASRLDAEELSIFSEQFSDASYDNPGWTTWHAPWGSFPTVSLAGDSASLSIASREGSCGIAILIDITGYQGSPLTLSGEWGGTATGGEAWVEVLMFQTDDPDMTDLTSRNFGTYDGPGAADIALKHDSFGLPDTTWGPEAFADDEINNGAAAGFGGLTQVAGQPYLVIALKVGRHGTITGLDNLRLTASRDSQGEIIIEDVRYDGDAFEVLAACLDPAKRYRLRRSLDGGSYADVGAEVTGAVSAAFVDLDPPTLPPAAIYRIRELEEP